MKPILSAGASALGVAIEPSERARYRVKHVFTTYFGSWEVGQQPPPYGIERWARDEYLLPLGHPEVFDDAGADHHFFTLVLGKDGNRLKNHVIRYWTPEYSGNDSIQYSKRSGWANIAMEASSSFSPDTGERGVWAAAPDEAEVVTGVGLPNKHHVSTFVVWQEVDGENGDEQKPSHEARISALELWARGIKFDG